MRVTAGLGKLISKRRELLGLTQREAAAKAGISNSHWANVERGNLEVRPPTMRAIGDVLSMPDLVNDATWNLMAIQDIITAPDPWMQNELRVVYLWKYMTFESQALVLHMLRGFPELKELFEELDAAEAAEAAKED
jgi:transcriptional regulator with XRE-family HTH domain